MMPDVLKKNLIIKNEIIKPFKKHTTGRGCVITKRFLYCTSRGDGCHQTVQLDIPVSYVLTGIP